jgi:hypothetical protein
LVTINRKRRGEERKEGVLLASGSQGAICIDKRKEGELLEFQLRSFLVPT